MHGGSRPFRVSTIIGRFNQRILRLTQAGSNWAYAAIRIGTLMFAVGVILLPLIVFWNVNADGSSPEITAQLSPIDFFGLVIFSPITETLLLALIHRLIWPYFGLNGFVLVTVILAAAAHAPLKSLPPITVAIGFAIMSYQYVSFREQLGFGRAFWGVALAHATNNGIAAVLLLAVDFLA